MEKFLFNTLFFGFFMSLFMVSMQKEALKELGITEFNEGELKVKQEKIITSTLSGDEIIERLKNTKWNGKVTVSKDNKFAYINLRANWRSWGEKVIVEIKGMEKNKRQVKISSRPKGIITLIDYGRNTQNVRAVEQTLEA